MDEYPRVHLADRVEEPVHALGMCAVAEAVPDDQWARGRAVPREGDREGDLGGDGGRRTREEDEGGEKHCGDGRCTGSVDVVVAIDCTDQLGLVSPSPRWLMTGVPGLSKMALRHATIQVPHA